MIRRFFDLPGKTPPKMHNAFRYASIILVASAFVLPIEVYLAIRSGAWQLWGGVGAILGVFLVTFPTRRLILNGKLERAAQVLIYSVLIGVVANTLLITDIGIGLGITAVLLTVAIAPQVAERPERFFITGFVVGAITILLDLFLPPYRLVVPELKVFTPIITFTVVIVLGFMTLQRFQDFSLRTKMILVITTLVIVSVATVAFLTDRSLSTNLTESIGTNMAALANSKSIEIANAVDREFDILKASSLNDLVRNSVELASQQQTLSQAEIEQLDNEWRAADKNNDNTRPLLVRVLGNRTASLLRVYQEQFPQHVEIFLTDRQGLNLAATNRTSDYYQGDEEWWQTAYKNGQYIGQPEFDESTKTVAIIMAVALHDNVTGDVNGILRTTVNFSTLQPSLAAGSFGKTGRTEVYLPDGREIGLKTNEDGTVSLAVDPSEFGLTTIASSEKKYFETLHNQAPVLASQVAVVTQGDQGEDTLAISSLNWRVIVFQDLTEALQPVRTQTRNIVFLSFVIAIAAVLAAIAVAQVISGPLIRLNAIAEKVAAGDLSAQATVETGDETGALAATFNKMTSQLQDLIGTLEQRVADRTKALATSAEVSRRLSTIVEQKRLVTEVVEQVRDAFNYYHVQIYFFNQAKDQLVMAGGTGEAGQLLLTRDHSIPKGKGLVGRAAETNISVLVSDTSKEPNWLPNPLLPETKSEAAIPIAIGDQVLGVLDVQHNLTDGLQQEDVDLLQSIARQVAVAMQNIASAEIVIKRASELQTVATISTAATRIRHTQDMLAAVVRLTQSEFGFYHAHIFIHDPQTAELKIAACGWKAGDPHEGSHETTILSMDRQQSLVARAARTRQPIIVNDIRNEPGWLPNPLLPDTAAELAVPLIVGDQVLGVLDVQSDRRNAFTNEDANILTTLATQTATALQNATSYIQAQRQAEREMKLNDISQKIQSATTIEMAFQTAVRELGHALGKRPTRVKLASHALPEERGGTK